MWSTTVIVDVPEDATFDTLNDWNGPHAELGGKIVSDASNNIEWKQGEITEVEDPMPEWDEIKDQVNTEKT